ncbi:hypothetical protein [Halomonas salifodinae]|uniref:hypothetical protein n=1 Tax=Halomonas salifodinae TaxID=438745 RepID=UPI0033AD310E
MMSYKDCTEKSQHPKKVLRDKGSKSCFEIDNPSRREFTITRVDGCMIQGHVEKCDYMVGVHEEEEKGVLHLVELKGKKLDKAISQLESTLQRVPEEFERYRKLCYAITTVIPKGGPRAMKKKVEFERKNSAILKYSTMRYKVTI